MSRTRQISAVDVKMREQIRPTFSSQRGRTNYYVPMNYSKNRPSLINRLRSGNTQAILTNGCNSMRDLCSSVQSITNDITNLLNSVESILPIIATYLSAPPKETISISPETAKMNESHHETLNAANVPEQQRPVVTPQPAQPQTVQQPTNQQNAPRLRPEDIQKFLENPLVKNIITNFMQNPPPMGNG